MQLVELEHCAYQVLALPSVLDELGQIPADRRVDLRGLKAKFHRFSEDGQERLTSANFHEADKSLEIWAFIHGRHRAYCFFDGPSVVVVTSVIMKKTQKPDRKVIKHACRVRKDYFEAKQSRRLQIDR